MVCPKGVSYGDVVLSFSFFHPTIYNTYHENRYLRTHKTVVRTMEASDEESHHDYSRTAVLILVVACCVANYAYLGADRDTPDVEHIKMLFNAWASSSVVNLKS